MVTRRLFEKDTRRHFIGEVTAVSQNAFRARGFVYVCDEWTMDFARRDEIRTRIFSLTNGNLIVNILPKEVNLGEIRVEVVDNKRRFLTDDKKFRMDVSEFLKCP